ncbi:outer membrane protein beta-barrel domain protein [Bacteriovorax sp. Seq25_V]|uniref:outer membrane protein beta-barrel domain protein n=1 Tax=Bacteriovorax sp. Seq25_V TaxID=1201288 RepID=UPI000389DF98|nr:outer membrane protein beta-barrel domain protein [Bacteriovorax sp. Seq25_V]EQC44406.1 outer membrane protein beta-barrel domain protein [Bacteriovorax sp. Seq25_V]
MKIFTMISLLLLSQVTLAEEIENNNLVIIQKVDNRAQSFVIRKGMADQIYKGQRSLFSNKSTSVVAKAITVSRDFSQWELEDKNASVSFESGDIITVSYSIEKIWTEIPRMISDKEYQNILKTERKLLLKKYGKLYEGRFQILGGISQGLSESTTESENNDGARVGNNYKFKYTKAFNDFLRYEVGFRYDDDVLTLSSPDLEISSQRYMATVGLQTRFNDFWELDATPYASLSLGYGKTQSQLNESVKTGTASIVPSFTLGVDIPYSKRFSFLIEGTVESISATETFSDGVEQRTNITQALVSLGIEFN